MQHPRMMCRWPLEKYGTRAIRNSANVGVTIIANG
jgi:hypothetical protein